MIYVFKREGNVEKGKGEGRRIGRRKRMGVESTKFIWRFLMRTQVWTERTQCFLPIRINVCWFAKVNVIRF